MRKCFCNPNICLSIFMVKHYICGIPERNEEEGPWCPELCLMLKSSALWVIAAECKWKKTPAARIISPSTSSVCLRRLHSLHLLPCPKIVNLGSCPHRKCMKSPVSRPRIASATKVLITGAHTHAPAFTSWLHFCALVLLLVSNILPGI